MKYNILYGTRYVSNFTECKIYWYFNHNIENACIFNLKQARTAIYKHRMKRQQRSYYKINGPDEMYKIVPYEI